MSRKPHPADEDTRAALASARSFLISLFRGPGLGYETHPASSLAKAREIAKLLPEVRGSARQAIVYAVTSDGRSLMIPRNLEAPSDGRLPMTTERTWGNDRQLLVTAAFRDAVEVLWLARKLIDGKIATDEATQLAGRIDGALTMIDDAMQGIEGVDATASH